MDIDLICSQTNYTKEEAERKLLELGDPIKVIRDYLGIKDKIVVLKPYAEINAFMNLKNRPTV
jgi:hypothetical protein